MNVKLIVTCLIGAMFSAGSLMAQAPTPLQSGSVTGIIRTAGGAPAAGIRVTAMRADAMDDALRAMVSLTQTDSTGRYRLDNVPAGRYYIAAGRVDLPTYYPGTLALTQGTAVSISSAVPLTDIDFVIQETSAAVPPQRGTFGVRPRVVQPFTVPNAVNRGRQIPLVPMLPQQAIPVPAVPTPPPPPNFRYQLNTNLRNQLGVNLGAIASQPNAAWWTNAALVARLGLTAEQMKKVEATFDQYRQTIVANTSDLAKEEAALSRSLESDPLEPVKTISAQIERLIQARGELERTNSKMTLDMRQILTRAQWVQLQMETLQPLIGAARALQSRGANAVRPARQP
jgi:hypothetical protein